MALRSYPLSTGNRGNHWQHADRLRLRVVAITVMLLINSGSGGAAKAPLVHFV